MFIAHTLVIGRNVDAKTCYATAKVGQNRNPFFLDAGGFDDGDGEGGAEAKSKLNSQKGAAPRRLLSFLLEGAAREPNIDIS